MPFGITSPSSVLSGESVVYAVSGASVISGSAIYLNASDLIQYLIYGEIMAVNKNLMNLK